MQHARIYENKLNNPLKISLEQQKSFNLINKFIQQKKHFTDNIAECLSRRNGPRFDP